VLRLLANLMALVVPAAAENGVIFLNCASNCSNIL
jgi:hypothetical protein